MRNRHLVAARCLAGVVMLLLPTFSPAAAVINDPRVKLTTLTASGLDRPVSFDFIGNDDMLVVEQFTGNVKRVHSGVVSNVATLSDIGINVFSAETGLLGIAASPSFATDHHVYLYYTSAFAQAPRL